MKHWQSYWNSGQHSSIPNDVKDIYGLTLKGFWGEVFSAPLVPPKNAILEVCCGNGALPNLLLTQPMLQQGHWHATDYSSLNKANFAVSASDSRLKIQGKVNAEKLPFEDETYDVVVSQFGIEYANDNAFLEALRVLVEGGIFAFIAHPASSRLITEHQQALVAKDSAMELIAILKRLSNEPQRQEYKDSFNAFMANTPDQIKRELALAGMFEAANAFFAQALKINKAQRQGLVGSIERCFVDYYARMEDMVAAALTEQRIDRLCKLLEAKGASLSLHKEISVEGQVVAIGQLWQK
ncbi:class I SAM-dependent methyltransferase [Neiella marina]|uniref:Class I SAM-dependent methyltransferase n=1 Tax=Neiella holothuriorum TaxID=2870530 RepID=A0ABS7EGV1_9GAMM|nr:class I SAM-dependent methyltransferase [Neiella holothuriorum]MBW8190912.1 class I SAM-dependent methyltransferase [Neiella holothuriorum]